MADEIKVTITGKDGVSKVFQEVSKSADSMQKSLSQDAAAAGTSLTKMSADARTASANTSRSFADMKTAASSASQSFAVAGAAMGASLALFSRDIVSNQQQVANLTRTYGDAAGQLQAFAQQIQSSTTFSSEAAIESANIFGTLARNYGVSVDQIQQLIQVSTDLAATSGLSLQDVSERVQAAIRGEGEAAEALGLTMNQQAIDRNNLTLTMSNQEAAQFRLNALFEQTSFAEGAAGEKAATTAGQITQLNNTFQDMARGAIEAAGPLPQVVSGITSIGAESALAITGVVSLVKGMRDLSVAMKGLGGAEGGGTALKGISLALGGEGLVASLGAAAVAAASVTAAFLPMIGILGYVAVTADDAKNAMTNQTDAINDWARAISDPALREGYTFLAQDLRDFDVGVQDSVGNVVDITDALDKLLALNPGDLQKVTEALAANGIAIGNLDPNNLEQLQIVYAAIDAAYVDHVAYTQQVMEVEQSHAQAISDLTEYFGPLNTVVEESTSNFAKYWLEINKGEIGTRRAAAGLNDLGHAAAETAGPLGRLVESIDKVLALSGQSLKLDFGLTNDDVAAIMGGYTSAQKEQNAAAHETAATLKGEYANSLKSVSTLLEEGGGNLNAATDALRDQEQALIDYTQQAFDAAKAVDLLSTNAQLFQAAGIKTPALDVAVNLQGGQNAFDPVMGAIKQAQSMASSLGGAKSWADELIGDPGTWSQLNQLLTDGRINQEQYNDAQAAQVSISRDVTNAQQDLLAVQANLAPVMADAVHQQADYINSLQDLPAQQQLVALGYMDTAESAKAMQLAQLAAASTTDTMQASTGAMIEAAAAADPVLKAMLEDMGLLDAKTGHVNFDTNAVDVGTAVTELTTSIDALIIALGGIPPIHTESNAAKTMGDVDALSISIGNIPDSHDTNITATDNASGVIGGVSQALDNINGKTASTYLNNYVTTFTTAVTSVSPGTGTGGGGAPIGGSRNGGVIGFAGGGFVNAELAENGPELLRFRDGGETIVPRRGLYAVPVGASVLPAEATRATLRERGGGDVYIDMRGASITIEATDGDVAETWRSWAINQARTG